MVVRTVCALLALPLLAPAGAASQDYPIPADVASPEAVILAAYDAIAHAPGENFDWDRFRSLHLPGALLVPNTEQTGGTPRVLSVQEFIDWIDGITEAEAAIGSEADKGFVEEQVHIALDRYGDVAQAMSTYEKHYWGEDQILGRGVNSFSLVFRDDRWWIVSIVWDEEDGAGPIPDAYLP
jgi:hypothetical protein